jgi:hypothetical protein
MCGSGNLYLNRLEKRKQKLRLFLIASGSTLINHVRNTAISSALPMYAAEEINTKNTAKIITFKTETIS